jgi:hypothetical protein
VILAGAFTSTQKALTLKRTDVKWDNISRALVWLSSNNKLYEDEDINVTDIIEPIVLEEIHEVESENTNIERVFEMNAVFPDSGTFNSASGGYDTRSGFREATLEKMLCEADRRETKLISRSTANILQDYQGSNLLKAFPVLFPYGVGYKKKNDDVRSGVRYLKFLSMLSSKLFHEAQFCCVLHNMFERQRMVSNAYLRNPTTVLDSFTTIGDEEILEAVSRFQNGCSGLGPADIFLRKMQAVTASMAHTEGAAKRARQQIFANLARFGLPAVMFTVTPVDDINF